MTRIAPNPQGSRAGLITALVVFVILFVASAIFAIYYGTQWQAESQHHVADINKYATYVTEKDFSNPDVQALTQGPAHSTQDAIELAVQQRGAATNPDAVAANTARALQAMNKDLAGISSPAAPLGSDNLLGSLSRLTQQIIALNANVVSLQGDLKAANEKITQVTKEREALLAAKDQQIAAAVKLASDADAKLAAREAGITQNVSQIQSSADVSVKASQQQAATAATEISKLQATIKTLQTRVTGLIVKLNNYRIDPSISLRHASGTITRVPGDNTVYISQGQGQQVPAGLTFEVYDKHKGLPPLKPANGRQGEELPAGKASIEVIRVLPGGSECRIIRVATGEHIIEGDIIMNLVYNPHTKFEFVVYGDFDLANLNQPSPGDARVMERLVEQWGGRLSTNVTVNTDFLVMGREPQVHNLPDSNPSPTDTARREKEQADLSNYMSVQSKAIELGVPILDQNRFLYFVGYYDQATR